MSFLNAFFLFALSAAVLPVVFHLVRKMKAKQVPFSSLMFLKATPKERVRRRRLRDVLLMAVRAGLLALLALAFARPYLPERALPFLADPQNRSLVLMIDRSYSMQYGDRFEQARAEALRRLDAAGPDDEITVLAFDDVVQQLTPLSTDRTLHRTVLENLRPGYRTTDFYMPLRRAEEILADARHQDRRIVLLSDFQQNGWGGSFENWTLDPAIRFEPVSVAQDAADNASLDAFTLTRQRTGDRVAVRLDARVRGQGAPAKARKEVTLRLDGAVVDRRASPPVAAGQVTFLPPPLDGGVYRGSLALTDDKLAADNRYYFTFPVEPRPVILLVDEAPRGTRRDAFFLEKALLPADDGPYRIVTGGRGRLTAAELRRHRVVFLSNLRTLTPAQTDALRRYVEDGGSVIFSFGDRADATALAGPLRTLGVGTPTGRVTARAVQPFDAVIGTVDLRHPIFSIFVGTGAIFRPVFRTYMRLLPDTSAVVLGRYDTEDPFLLERRLGRGEVLVYTATFNADWTDFPVQEMYVPFVYQLVRHALHESDVRYDFRVGDPVPLTGRPGDVWDVQTPDDRLFKVPVEAAGQGFFRETDAPGLYVAALGRRQYHFAVNVDPAESDLAVRDPEEAYAAVVPPSETLPAPPASQALEAVEQRQKLWRFLVLLALALFAFETYYAHRQAPVRNVSPPRPNPSGRVA